MVRPNGILLALACTGILGAAEPALAQQTLNLSVGYFAVRAEDGRNPSACVRGSGANCDVLVQNLDFLSFDVNEFNGVTFGGEWLVALGQYLEAGAGASFYQRSVPSVYSGFVDRDGTEIEQDLTLRIVPVALTVRVLPLGQTSPVQPYFGGGLGVFRWRYSETGEFIDFGAAGRPVFRDSFVAKGSKTGPIAVAGLRFAGDAMSVGGEIRYHSARAELTDEFSASAIDLGGITYQFTVGIRFGR